MPIDLAGRVIIITGASSGIGAATAIECAKAGMHVVLEARRDDRLREVAAGIDALGARSCVVAGDVTESGMSARLLDAADSAFGRFDAVFANAGYGIEKAAIDCSDHEIRRIFEVNFFAGLDLLQQSALRLAARAHGGHLLMCSSCLAKFTLPYYGFYSATKAAQNHVCRAMRLELESRGIEVSSVHPVATQTEFFDVAGRLSRTGAGSERVLAVHAPRAFTQSPQRVARAVVRCLRRPRPEVWTSFSTRLGAAAMTLWPSLGDVIMRRVRGAIERGH